MACVAGSALLAACGGRDSLYGGLLEDDTGGGHSGGASGSPTVTGGANGFGFGGAPSVGGSSMGVGGTPSVGGSAFAGNFSGAGFGNGAGSTGFGGSAGFGAVAGSPFAGSGFGATSGFGNGGFSATAGASFGGVSGFGNAGFSFAGSSIGGAGSGGGAGFSGAAGFAGAGGSLGSLGDPCSTNGALACHGPAQRLRLLCDDGYWRSNGTCVESENCDQRTGVCAPIVIICKDHEPGARVCAGDELLSCGPDLVTTSSVMTCVGRCVATSTSAECAEPACGDGKVETGEQCDDGDRDDTDACTNECTNAYCGDGSIYAAREVCDDENQLPRDGCSVVCGADAVEISLGSLHTCAVGTTGKAQCWGYNGSGQLGLGDTFSRGSNDGDMGPGLPAVALGTGKTAVSVAAGGWTSCAIMNDGGVKCWGSNYNGSLGVGDNASRGTGPNQMGDNLPAVPLGTGRTALKLGLGVAHTCALLDDHSIKCWGYNVYGQLGQGDTQSRGDVTGELGDALPPIALGTGRTALALAVGGYHNCALLDDHTLKCWGLGYNGQLGLGDTSIRGAASGEMGDALPTVDLGAGRTALAVAAGEQHTCAVLDDGSVKCWGYNSYGQLGLGDAVTRGVDASTIGDQLPPVALGTGRTAKSIAAGTYLTCAILDDDSLKCWGYNYQGGLGIGDTATRGDGVNEMGDFLPAVNLGAGRTAKSVAIGSAHTCALLDNESIKCWGSNNYGQLGLGVWGSLSNVGDGAGEMGDNLPYVRATF